MYDTQEIALRIKQRTKQVKVPMKVLLPDCGLNINVISDLANGRTMSCVSLALIADRLDCQQNANRNSRSNNAYKLPSKGFDSPQLHQNKKPPDCNNQAVFYLFTRLCGSPCVQASAKTVQPCGRFYARQKQLLATKWQRFMPVAADMLRSPAPAAGGDSLGSSSRRAPSPPVCGWGCSSA